MGGRQGLIVSMVASSLQRTFFSEKCRAIGVSNFVQSDLEEMLEYCSVRPHANQFEFHPYYNDVPLRNFCKEENILFTVSTAFVFDSVSFPMNFICTFQGYCPLAKGTILTEPPILRLAEKYQRSPAQICIRWSVQQRVPAIPKSLKFDRLRENAQVFDFEIEPGDMAVLNHVHNPDRKCIVLKDLQKKFVLPDGYKLSSG